MDSQDQVIQKLSLIDRDLKSLRYTFGIVLIILTVLLASVAPMLVKLVGSSKQSEPSASAPSNYKGMAPPAKSNEMPKMPVATTTATTTVTPTATTTAH